MRKDLGAFIITPLLFGCGPPSGADRGRWRAYVENGDKPGIGIEIVRGGGSTTGSMFILDPNKPDDFSAGLPRRMQDVSATGLEMRYRVDWGADNRKNYVLMLESPLQDEPVLGVLQAADGAGAPRTYQFKRIR